MNTLSKCIVNFIRVLLIMSRLIAAFIRHGDYHQLKNVPSALQPFALTDRGQQQARQAANLLLSQCQEQQWVMHSDIDCSSSLRAWQTAQKIKSVLQNQAIKNYIVSIAIIACVNAVSAALPI